MPVKKKILVCLVTRHRPIRAVEAYDAWWKNSSHVAGEEASDFMVAYDDDDESYHQSMFPAAIMSKMKPAHLGPALNMRALLHCNDYVAICNIGDDHLIRTKDWDKKVLAKIDEIGGHGVLYGDDMVHGQGLATAPVMTCELIKALGWMALPNCNHMYIDNAWMDIARGIGKLVYMPEIVTEHLHPSVGKATMDAMYEKANTQYPHDHAGICEWRSTGGMAFDIEKVKRHLAGLK